MALRKQKRTAGLLSFLALSLLTAVSASGQAPAAASSSNQVRHVLLISVDGMHSLDYQNCAKGISGVNGGQPYCPNLAALGLNGVNYLNATTSKPSDSFPGLMAIVTGGSPRSVGAFYDVAYDRVLAPPAKTTGNGVASGPCTPNVANGTTTEYEEGIDIDQTQLNGGAPTGDGGIELHRSDPPGARSRPQLRAGIRWNFVRTNTIFGVVHAAGGYTAWSDKHPAYSVGVRSWHWRYQCRRLLLSRDQFHCHRTVR